MPSGTSNGCSWFCPSRTGTIRELARTSCCGKLRMGCISTNEKACSGIQPETLSLLPDRLLERSSGAKERLLAVRK